MKVDTAGDSLCQSSPDALVKNISRPQRRRGQHGARWSTGKCGAADSRTYKATEHDHEQETEGQTKLQTERQTKRSSASSPN
ncbi:MAG: hypothetical protein KGS72_09750 [Cyanobacteria bacterium REEB67]|nr:hypothetical protein [Cyanobacteria bacterium REEB67]